MNLAPVFLYGKAAPHADFVWQGNSEPPPRICAAAKAWFRCHVEGVGDGQTVAIVSDTDDSLWLLRVTVDGTDAGGRVSHSLVTARFLEAKGEIDVGTALLAAFAKKLPSRASWEARSCSLPSSKSAWSVETERLPRLLAQRVLGLSEVLSAGSPPTVATLTERLGLSAFEWFAASSGTLPGGLLPGGPGIIIVSQPIDGPEPPAELRVLFENETQLDLAALLAAAPDAPRRRELLALAAGRPPADKIAAFKDPELDWLMRTVPARSTALGLANRVQVDRLVRSDLLLSAEEVEAVRDRIDTRSDAQACALAPLLSRHGRRELFLSLFGPAAPGLEEFLSPNARACWNHILSPDTIPEPPLEVRGEAFEEISTLDMLSRLPLRTLARFQRWPLIGQAFCRRLAKEGLPEPIAAWLCQGVEPSSNFQRAPALEPNAAWVSLLDASRLEVVGRWSADSPDAAAWWRAALSAHPAFAGAKLDDFREPWRPARGWLAVAKVQSGEMCSEELFVLVMRWHAEAAPGWNDSIAAEMLRRAGFDPGSLDRIAAGTNEAAAALVLKNLAWLHKAGLADLSALFRHLPVDRIARVLDSAALDASLYALLDLGSFGPPGAPGDGAELPFLAILPRLLHERRFWGRWHNGIPWTVLEWLAVQTAGLPEQQLVLSVQGAWRGETLPDATILALVADALPGPCSIHLLFAAAYAGREEEARALLKAKAVRDRPDLARWLESRLWFPMQPPPPLARVNDDELHALLPALDAREIAQFLESRPAATPVAHELREAITARLRSHGGISRLAQLSPHISALLQPAFSP